MVLWKFYISLWLSLSSSKSLQVIRQVYTMLVALVRSLLLLSVAPGQVLTAPAPAQSLATNYTGNATAAFNTLQKWYNRTTGLYDTTGWWNSANALTTIGDLAALNLTANSTIRSQVISVLANSFVAAQEVNLTKIVRVHNSPSLDESSVSGGVVAPAPPKKNGFIDKYYDDEGWWALVWIQAYDITKNGDYLTMASSIFEDMKNGSTTHCGGGIWWDKAHTYVAAIANELYLSVASHLANRASNKEYYLAIAQHQFDWFQRSGMINSKNNVNDGLTSACKNNAGAIYSYNQGVILGALVELNKASPNTTYLTVANNIATAAIGSLGSTGVLHDTCDGTNTCGADASQFKGVFMRNLQQLQKASPNSKYLNFITTTANSIWAKDRNAQNQLSVDWSGPFKGSANASTQSSALDALVAAAAFLS